MPKDKGKGGKGGKKGKKDKDNKSFQSKVVPYTIEVTQALTAISLLDSSEDTIVFLSTCSLDTFITTYGKHALVYLQEQDFLGKLFNNLQKCEQIRLLSLKLIAKLLQLEQILPRIQHTDDYVTALINVFMATENVIEVEYTTYLLSRICVRQKCAEFLCKEDIVAKIFHKLVESMDLDIKNNCLHMLLRLVRCHHIKKKVSDLQSFRIGVLNLVLHGPFKILQPVTVDIFAAISSWEYSAFQKQLFDNQSISYLLEVLLDEKWTNVQNEALTSISNCLKYNPVQVKFVESKNFLQFCKIGREYGPEHALGCVALIHELVEEKLNRQAMLELRIHEHLYEYCKFDDDLVTVKFCDALAVFCQNCHIIPELATVKVVKEIDRLMRKTELPWIPYRQAGIHPLYLFLMDNPRVGILFFKTNILKQILDALHYRHEMEQLNYKMVLQMFQAMLCSKCLHEYLWSKEVYAQFVKLLTDTDSEFIKIAIDVIQRTFYSQEYRGWFLETDGVQGLSKMICKRDCDYIDEGIGLCKIAAKYAEICIELMRGGLIPVIQDLASCSIRQKPICDSIVDDIYKCELSIKFHDTWFLDYHDITKNGFSFYVGFKPRAFLPEEVTDLSKFSFTSTIITVNFHGKKHEKTPAAYAVHEEVEADSGSGEESAEPDGEVASEGSAESIPEKKFIYKLSLPLPDKGPTTDIYLKNYLKKVRSLLNDPNNNSIAKKITALAKFVAMCLSGYDGAIPKKHQYETHIVELKKKYLSNYIPIGAMRMGRMIERAVLFKVLADRVCIPCTLRRSSDFGAWNEVTIYSSTASCVSPKLRYNLVEECVVDLMEDVGALLLKGQHNTDLYCQKSELYIDLGSDSRQTYSMASNDLF